MQLGNTASEPRGASLNQNSSREVCQNRQRQVPTSCVKCIRKPRRLCRSVMARANVRAAGRPRRSAAPARAWERVRGSGPARRLRAPGRGEGACARGEGAWPPPSLAARSARKVRGRQGPRGRRRLCRRRGRSAGVVSFLPDAQTRAARPGCGQGGSAPSFGALPERGPGGCANNRALGPGPPRRTSALPRSQQICFN